MVILIAIILGLGVIVAVMSKLFVKGDDAVVPAQGDCSTCSGDNATCVHDCMLKAAVSEIEYYDDEELDRYRGRPSDGYTDDEAAGFREVMLTMRPDEVAGWMRSLAMRGINPPDQIKDEMIMLMG